MSFAFSRRAVSLALLFLLSISCGSTRPSRFYLLSPNDGSPKVAPGETPSLGVGPITFPAYLDRTEIVIRRDGEIDLQTFERWAEPLPGHFLSVLVDNLAGRTGSDRVYSFRWPGIVSFDHRLAGSVSRFEVDSSGQAVLSIQWRIVDAEGTAVVPTRRSRFTAASTAGDYRDMAAALSRTLAAFSDEVAAALAEL